MNYPYVNSCRQRGAALVMALLIMSLVVILATSAESDHLITYKRASNRLFMDQTRLYLLGAEDLGRRLLIEDKKLGMQQGAKPADYLGEIWAQDAAPYPVDGGWVGGKLEDLQGRFNLNLLANKVQTSTPGAQPQIPTDLNAIQNIFARLLRTFPEVPLSEQDAVAITAAVVDWMDNDDIVFLSGAESMDYESANPPYMAANQPFVSTSELRMIKGFPPALYDYLAPHVVALPVNNLPIKININTATPNLLRALGSNGGNPTDPVDARVIEPLLQQRMLATLEVNQVTQLLNVDSLVQPLLDTQSEYFLLKASAQIGDVETTLYSILQRPMQVTGGQPNSPIPVDVLLRSSVPL